MKKLPPGILKCLLPALVLVWTQTALAQKNKIALIDSFVVAKARYHGFNGNVLVAEKGRIIYQKSLGFSHFKLRTPLTSESVFNLASISKEFTAATVMLCVERGLINLDDELTKYFPEIPYEGVTVRQMLTHTSGLPEQNELLCKYWNSDTPVSNKDMVQYLIRYKPDIAFKPGEGFKYCNTNYSLLALIVEKVSGETFRHFTAKSIFEPLGMTKTRLLDRQQEHHRSIPNATENYIFDEEKNRFSIPEEIPQWKKALPLSGLYGAGNVYSTASDLMKWQESLKTARILKRESIREMQKVQAEGNVDGSDGYGYGFAIKSIYGDTKVFHNGGTLGYWNALQHFQNADRTIIVLSNNESEKGLTNAIAAILFDQQVALPSSHREVKLSPSELNRFVGTYEANGRSFSIENRKDKLFRVVAGGEPMELKPESKNKLFYVGVDRQIEFTFTGKKVTAFFIADGLKLALTKVK